MFNNRNQVAHVIHETVHVVGIPTPILRCGDYPTSRTKAAVVVIPGNPGIALYYQEFIEALHEQLACPVMCVSHAGHAPTIDTTQYTLQDQIQHKFFFIQNYIPHSVRLVLIGHSIGCFMILHFLDDLPPDRVTRSIFLFPTIERMASSPRGFYVAPLLRYFRCLAPVFVYMLTFLPKSTLNCLLQWYFDNNLNKPFIIEATKMLLTYSTVSNVVCMAHEEMYTVVRADYDILDRHINKIWFYYGATDHWCPISYSEEMRAVYPQAQITVCQHDLPHAFCLEWGRLMSRLVSQHLEQQNIMKVR